MDDILVTVRPELVEGHRGFDKLSPNGVLIYGTLNRACYPRPGPRTMKLLAPIFTTLLLFFVTGCTAPEFRERVPVTDNNLNGTWLIRKAELGGKNLPMPPTFELQISGTQYRAGVSALNDRGKIVLFGDELAGQTARMDVVGEDGPSKGKRFPSIYRFNGREMELCLDYAEKERPGEFVSRDGTLMLRVIFARK